MSKPEYQDLVDILRTVWKTSRVESVLGVEWVNYPVEVFDELSGIVCELTLEDEGGEEGWRGRTFDPNE